MTRPIRPPVSASSGPNYREPELIPGGSRIEEPLMWVFVLFAVAGDVAAFYSVLARLFGTQPVFIVVGTLAFASGAVGSSHVIGSGLKRRRSGDRHRSDALLWLAIAFWLALGAAAFVARLYFGPVDATDDVGGTSFGVGPAAAGPDKALLAALAFAGLYLVSGLLAMTASYNAFNPAARAYRKAVRTLKKASQTKISCAATHAAVLEHHRVLEAEHTRAPQLRADERLTTEADAVGLKIAARHLMAARVGDGDDGRALALFMLDAPTPEEYPRNGSTP